MESILQQKLNVAIKLINEKNQLWKLNETQLKSKPKNQNEIKITKKKKKEMTKCKFAMTL